MRAFPKWLANPESKSELLKITEMDSDLSQEERVDKEGKDLDPRIIDKIWGEKYKTDITRHIKVARDFFEFNHISETPLTLLEAALKKLKHEKMELQSIQVSDRTKAKILISNIRERINEIEHEFYQVEKGVKRGRKNLISNLVLC